MQFSLWLALVNMRMQMCKSFIRGVPSLLNGRVAGTKDSATPTFLPQKHQRFTYVFSSPSNKQFKVETLIFILDFNSFSTTNSAFYCSDALHEILMLLSSVYKAGFNSVRIETAQL